jgi:hypothetical protein
MFLFDGVVYDADYFRRRMAESRQRRADQRRAESEHQSARAWQRTPPVNGFQIDLEQSSGLIEALNQLIGGAPPESVAWVREAFDLAAYERHVLAELHEDDHRSLLKMPGLRGRSDRIERIRLFIACLFLEHAGRVVLDQRPNTIWVTLRETD